ncbi:MAG TPA: 5'/3'-nucleotidase SurE [Prolixibacteraceae bacterium]|nr:5'/3'-nucleotidase SurE [Prolixibacteraceae bacterium]
MIEKPSILVTNDDGIHAKGLRELIEVMRLFGDVTVIAPEVSMSGMSGAVTVDDPLRSVKLSEEPGITVYKCNGTPVDCVKLGFNHLLEKTPDYVVSGINHGANTSISILYSGTMGAAMEGSLHGVPSIGFSLMDFHPDADFGKAKIYAARIFQAVMDNSLPRDTCLNVNIPQGVPKGIKLCRQARGKWSEEFDKRTDPHQRPYFWLSGTFHNYEENARDTDLYALEKSYVSVVPVKVDMTCYETLSSLKTWNF